MIVCYLLYFYLYNNVEIIFRDFLKTNVLEDIKKYIRVLDRAEINGDSIKGTFVSIHDSKHVDY